MGDSTEKNLKSYRNSELKWFLLANILLMLVTSGGLKFDSQDANVFSFIFKAIINRNLIVIDRVEFPNKMF